MMNTNIDGSVIVSKNSSVHVNMAWNKIHVLLVEHESRDHEHIMNILHFLSYKVTSVKFASNALSIISKGKVEFDLALVNMNSPDLLRSQLLHHATKIDLPLIFMTNEDDDLTSLMALEHGAYLCIKKPMTMAMLGCLWQFVLREKDLRLKETQAFAELMGYYKSQEREYLGKFVVESSNNQNHNNNNNNNNILIHDFEEKQKSSYGASSKQEQEQHNNDDAGSGRFHRRKDWLEWTVELHDKFMAAAKQLGQGKCYPKDILEIMDVPGLSRMQVASHLQKCRSAKWLPPNERNSKGGNNGGETAPRKGKKAPRAKTLRFGLMPNFAAETTTNYINKDQDQQCDHDFINHHHHHIPAAAASTAADPCPRLELLLDEEGLIFNSSSSSSNNNMGLDEHFINYGHDHDHQIFAPLTDIISNFEDPNFGLTTMDDDSSMLHHGHGFSSDFRQDLLMDFNGTWPSFIPHDHHQVADATDDQWFREALNPPDACGDGRN